MASLRTPATAASRLLRSTATAPVTRRPMMAASIVPAMRRLEISLTPSPNAETASPAAPKPLKNQPDYAAHTDLATSTFTPVPKRVLDGSEDNDSLPAAILSGAPMELEARTVRIYKPAKPATQSGTWHGHHWRMDWDILGKGHRWENPLMGWQSSGDYMQGTHIYFKTKEEAVAFAEKQGYEYYVQEPQTRKSRPKAYAEQFVYSPGKLKQVRTK